MRVSRSELERARLSLALLLERRILLFTIVDVSFLFFAVVMAANGNGRASEFYPALFLAPSLVLGVPAMAEAVAVERRSGTLDLALSSPGAAWYFERRLAGACLVLIGQGWLGLLFARTLIENFPLSGPAIQVVVVSLFLTAVVLNWCVRLKTPAAVIFATYTTVAVFMPWFFSNPIHPPAQFNRPMTAAEILQWCRDNLVLLVASALFYFYAVQRLMKPETVID